MQPQGTGLLEHFARLATHVTGTSAAVVSVSGQRKGQRPRRVGHALSTEEMNAIGRIEPILGGGPPLVVVPDVARDDRFDGLAVGFEEPRHRFLAHMRLTSPAGENGGFVCVMDEQPRPGLSETEVASLRHIAGMIMADRQREQRHLHLMHVADRALRVDRMLRLVADAASCAEALTNLLQALCQFHGAAVGQIWQLLGQDKPPLEISRYDRGAAPDTSSIAPLNAVHELAVDAIRLNTPQAIKLSRPEETGAAGEEGMFRGYVCVPVWVRQQRFGISLAFTEDDRELDAVMADIASLGDTIRPALFQKVAEERMRFAAHHDDLTQLSNRLMFQERLRKAIAEARLGDKKFAVLCLDLDGFKQINDTRGHEMGDRLLVAVARRLRESVREGDLIARMGGDEFAIIQPLDSQPQTAISLAKRLIDTVSAPFELAGRRAMIGVSVGISLYPVHGESPDLLLRHADIALYQAKNAGRKTWSVFDPDMAAAEQRPLLGEKDLRDAIAREEFTLAYQPVCDSRSRRVVGFEALLRWPHPTIGPIEPDAFIPLAEKSGLIVPLGRWALEKACAEAATWDPPVLLSVNLSPLQFRQPELPSEIADVLSRTSLPASRLRLEVTEGLLLDESDHVLRTMRGLQDQGIRIMLDDFGTAYASMSYLRRFPFDGIKIDKSFVRGLCNDEITMAIVQAILSLGERLKLSVVAEGVENERELDVLRGLGCRFFQGYLGGRPTEGAEAVALLRQTQLRVEA